MAGYREAPIRAITEAAVREAEYWRIRHIGFVR